MGRPKLPKDKHVKYQRISIYRSTYERIKKIANQRGKTITELLDETFKKA